MQRYRGEGTLTGPAAMICRPGAGTGSDRMGGCDLALALPKSARPDSLQL